MDALQPDVASVDSNGDDKDIDDKDIDDHVLQTPKSTQR